MTHDVASGGGVTPLRNEVYIVFIAKSGHPGPYSGFNRVYIALLIITKRLILTLQAILSHVRLHFTKYRNSEPSLQSS
jgi:hypothetical protein